MGLSEWNYLISEKKKSVDGLISRLDIAEKKYQWIQRQANRYYLDWNIKRRKSEKKETEHPRPMINYQAVSMIGVPEAISMIGVPKGGGKYTRKNILDTIVNNI